MIKHPVSGRWIPKLRLPKNISETMLNLSDRQRTHSPNSTMSGYATSPSTAPGSSRVPRPPPIKKATKIPYSHRPATKHEAKQPAALPPIQHRTAHKHCNAKCLQCSTVSTMISDFDLRLQRLASMPTRAASFKKTNVANSQRKASVVVAEPSPEVTSSLVALFADVPLHEMYDAFARIGRGSKAMDQNQFQQLLEECIPDLPLSVPSIQSLFQSIKDTTHLAASTTGTGKVKFNEFFALVANCTVPKEVRESVAHFLHCFDPTGGGRLPDLIFNAHFVEKFAKSHIQKSLMPRWSGLCATLSKHQFDGDLDIEKYAHDGIISTADATAVIFSKVDLGLSFLGLDA